jgi:hypothetical protein
MMVVGMFPFGRKHGNIPSGELQWLSTRYDTSGACHVIDLAVWSFSLLMIKITSSSLRSVAMPGASWNWSLT